MNIISTNNQLGSYALFFIVILILPIYRKIFEKKKNSTDS